MRDLTPRFVRPLTAGELRAVRLVGGGMTYGRAAFFLGVSWRTVEMHVRHAAEKLAESQLAPESLPPRQRVWWWCMREQLRATYGKRPPSL